MTTSKKTRWTTALLVAAAIAGRARAEDAAPASRTAAPLETRLFDVGAITLPFAEALPDRGPGLVSPDEVNSEDSPLFGAEVAPSRPLPIDTLIELVKSSVGGPGAWEVEGTTIAGQGSSRLVVRQSRAALVAVEDFLGETVRAERSTVVVDVAALAGDAATAGSDLAAAVAKGTLVPLAGARACGPPQHRLIGRVGGQAAYLGGHDVLVAEKAHASVPIVGVASDGLGFDARAISASADRVHLDLRAWWARRRPSKDQSVRDIGDVELPELDVSSTAARVDLVPGAWKAIPSAGAGAAGIVFAVRAAFRPFDVESRREVALVDEAGPDASAPLGTTLLRSVSIADLVERIANRRGRSIDLWPSNFTPPSPPDVADAQAPLPVDVLVDWVKSFVAPDRWGPGTSVDLVGSSLLVRTDAARQRLVGALVAGLRRRLVRTTTVRATVLSMPIATVPEYWSGLADTVDPLRSSRVVDDLSVVIAPGQRGATVGGHERRYVAEYAVRIATGAAGGAPVVRTAFDGSSLDVEVATAGNGAGVVAEVRFDRATPRASKTAATPYGSIECPRQGVLRMRGAAVLPYGATRLVVADFEGDEATFVLLSATGDER